MARGQRHTHCAFRRLVAEQGTWATHDRYRMGESWCGKESLYSESDRAEPVKMADCPECAKALGAFKLARLGGRVVLRKLDKAHSYHRSTYAVAIDGVERGYIGSEAGWGKGWELRGLSKDSPDAAYRYCKGISPDRPSRYDCRADNPNRIFWPIHYSARDSMAVAALAAFEAGELPTLAESAERDRALVAERAAREAEREAASVRRREEAERAATLREERLEAARMALEALGARELSNDDRCRLSNVELAGLAAMRALLGIGDA